MLSEGSRVRLTIYNEDYGLGTLTKKIGSPSDKYQWVVTLPDGRDFVVKEAEVKLA
jgi:hypothetical protein